MSQQNIARPGTLSKKEISRECPFSFAFVSVMVFLLLRHMSVGDVGGNRYGYTAEA